VNYSDHPRQCFVRLPLVGFAGWHWRLLDLLGEAYNEHHGNGLQSHGLDLAIPFRACRFRVQV
jgi:hypothetical protein